MFPIRLEILSRRELAAGGRRRAGAQESQCRLKGAGADSCHRIELGKPVSRAPHPAAHEAGSEPPPLPPAAEDELSDRGGPPADLRFGEIAALVRGREVAGELLLVGRERIG